MNTAIPMQPTEEVVGDYTIVRTTGARFRAWSGFVMCDLTIVWKERFFVVVVSQRAGYRGVSITNAIEDIKDQMLQAIPAAAKVRWFEHYSAGLGILANRYSLMEVSFDQGQASWGRLTSWEDVAEDTGVPLELLARDYSDELLSSAEPADA